MWKSLYSLFKKDCRMMVSGKFFFLALGSLLLYTLFIHFGYLKFMDGSANRSEERRVGKECRL